MGDHRAGWGEGMKAGETRRTVAGAGGRAEKARAGLTIRAALG
ncbi:hypothetical protein [Paragemmobacter kunshanensis]|nr:hypothetical protein [Rhodobacter kunshanensis]